MIKHIINIGDYFSGNYFNSEFTKKVIEKSGYSDEDLKSFESAIRGLKEKYFSFKKDFIDLNRVKDQIERTSRFHKELLKALGYSAKENDYSDLFRLDDTQVVPVRQKLYRGEKPHLFIMEMNALIKIGEQEPKGLFEQNWNRAQWEPLFKVQEGDTLTPSIINEAINEIFLIDLQMRPTYILLLGGNEIYLLHFEKWFKGSYLRFKLEDLFDEATLQKDYYQLFYLLLSKNGLAPEADILLMEQLDEDSHKSAYAVTKDLKEGIIHAVELLANEALHYKKQVLNEKFDESDDAFEQQVKDDCLTMVYRMLFLFYAESRPDLGILPTNDPVYEKGYSLDMLRELEQVQLNRQSSIDGYFFNESLQQLFQLLNQGYRHKEVDNKSFSINRLDTPLFDDEKFHHLKGIKFRNFIWQKIICELSLSQKQRGKGRGRISYANLGINQLGSVYEGLLAYRGFFAEQDYIEVHEAGKPNEGTYVVPRSRMDDFKSNEILTGEEGKPKILTKGTFVYRLSGRDRQQSASYYTPEVLTRTTVKYTLKPILEHLEKKEIIADDLLDLKILEPAQGASAFQNEVINQVADAYLNAKQKELKKKVAAKDYQDQLQRVKAYIATNNVYGVDINPTAIELGKLSLWLNVIHKEMEVPYFGYRLGVGNAVVGVWLKVHKKSDFIFTPRRANDIIGEKREWWEKAPEMRSFVKGKLSRKEEEIYHFLLPDKNMVPSSGIKLLKEEFRTEAKAVNEWRAEFCKPIRGDEFLSLQSICSKIDELLEEHYAFQNLINQTTGEKKNFFGHEQQQQQATMFTAYDEKDKLAKQRQKHNAPYFKLKMVMDYWCSLWFWDVRQAAELPTRKQWYEDVRNILELDLGAAIENEEESTEDVFAPAAEQIRMFEEPQQPRLKAYRSGKQKELSLESIKKYTNRADLFENKRLDIVKELATKYRFFHNQLEFIEVFKLKGGFDVIVGNPPWVTIETDLSGLLSLTNPEIKIRQIGAASVNKMASEIFRLNKSLLNIYTDEIIITESFQAFLGSSQNYILLKGQKNNLYRAIIVNLFCLLSKDGFSGMVHPETVYEDPKAYALRKKLFQHLRYHFHFRNGLNLFEIGHKKSYGINVMSGFLNEPNFFSIVNLYHPKTIDGCFIHNGLGSPGGITKIDGVGKSTWNLDPHKKRVINISEKELKSFAINFEGDINLWEGVKLPSIHSNEIMNVVNSFSNFENKIEDCGIKIMIGFDEAQAVKNNILLEKIGEPDYDKWDIVLGGPNFFVSNPINKSINNKGLYDTVNLLTIKDDFLPNCLYHYQNDQDWLKEKFGVSNGIDSISQFRLLVSRMLDSKTERTLQSSIIAPRVTHLNSSNSIVFKSANDLLEVAAIFSSLVFDFYIRATGATNLTDSIMKNIRVGVHDQFKVSLYVRTLLLNCLNKYYGKLWKDNYHAEFIINNWSVEDKRLKPFDTIGNEWNKHIPLRNYFERRQALVEIDVIVAMALGLILEELVLIYNVQFPVLQQNEDDTWYDQIGNIVFTCSKGLVGVGLDRPEWEKLTEEVHPMQRNLRKGDTYTHTITKSELYKGKQITYFAPFDKCDRVEDYKRAWAHFEERFKEK